MTGRARAYVYAGVGGYLVGRALALAGRVDAAERAEPRYVRVPLKPDELRALVNAATCALEHDDGTPRGPFDVPRDAAELNRARVMLEGFASLECHA